MIKHELGFYAAEPLPDDETLREYYNNKYFSADHQQYYCDYTDEELFHKTLACQETASIISPSAKSIIDIGCGEGFFVNHFHQLGFDTYGADFTHDGISHFFPELVEKVIKGNIFVC